MPEPTNTEVESISIEDMDNLLGTPGVESVMTPGETKEKSAEKPTFFQKDKVDMKFLDPDSKETPNLTEEEKAAAAAAEANLSDEEKEAKAQADAAAAEAKAKAEAEAGTGSFDDIVKEELDEELDEEGNKKGRPPLDKAGMAQLTQSLIDEEMILPFADEDKKLEDYTVEDYKELFKMNFDNQKAKVQEETPKEFFQSLPPELQYAAKYVADGGTDLKGMFRALARTEETKSISLDTESGQERTAKEFLQATNFGTDEEIQEQIDSWKDLDKLEDKATQFKPRLDQMREQIVQRQVAEQEAKRTQRETQSQLYADNIYNTLAKGELDGLKMNSKVQNMLYQGLIKPDYESVSGQPTNLFGHLIEQHQYVKPNHKLIAKALWLLADPQGFEAEIKKGAVNAAVEDTARKLKTEQSNKNTSSHEDKGTGVKPKPGLKREPKNFFKR